MSTILNLFGRSPFAPLQYHMDKVCECVHKLLPLFEAIQSTDPKKAEQICQTISEGEHLADLSKNDIRNHLPKSIFLPIDRGSLLEILSIQDSIADTAEDVAVLVTLKPIEILEDFKEDFYLFLKKNIECFDGVKRIIHEMHDLLEYSFGGMEAEKVRVMVNSVASLEHEADLIQRNLLKKLFSSEAKMSFTTFFLWQQICEAIASISNLSEKLAYRVRMTLELK